MSGLDISIPQHTMNKATVNIFTRSLPGIWIRVLLEYKTLLYFDPPPAKYGGRHTVTLIPGDGIGPELLNHIRELFRFCCVPVDFEVVRVDSSASSEDDINNAVTAIKCDGVALKSEHEQMVHQPQKCLLTSLDLYASVMHCQSLPGVPTCHKDIDVFIIRENTGEYSSVEHENVPGVVESLKIITRVNSLRISEYAFNLAREKGRRKVTAVHKANIMKLGDGLFLQCCKEVAAGYPEITFDNMIVDNTTMQATRNTGKSIANKNIANPTATLLASCLIFTSPHFFYTHTACIVICFHMSLYLLSLQLQTVDLGGQGTASEVVHSIMLEIQRGGPRTSEQI
uniref:Isocitrate dehydrogenase (NAD(+)) 3 non-catalytic subunit gamma n=1 Tax=Sinocyclocheilus rhinocerous TaxID=307959 RepID=A0A673I0P8_9TELE